MRRMVGTRQRRHRQTTISATGTTLNAKYVVDTTTLPVVQVISGGVMSTEESSDDDNSIDHHIYFHESDNDTTGSDDDENGNDCGYDYSTVNSDKKKTTATAVSKAVVTKQSKWIQASNIVASSSSNSSHKKKKNGKKSKRYSNRSSWYYTIYNEIISDPTFLSLFIRVAIQLGTCCLILYLLYNRYYPKSIINNSNTDIYNDDDTTAPWNDGGKGIVTTTITTTTSTTTHPLPKVAVTPKSDIVKNDTNNKLVVDIYNEVLLEEKNDGQRTVYDNATTQQHVQKQKVPQWNLTQYIQDWDAYAIYNTIEDDIKSTNNPQFWSSIHQLLFSFSKLYGGENSARALVDRGISTFGSIKYNNNNNGEKNSDKRTKTQIPYDLQQTACRFVQSMNEQQQLQQQQQQQMTDNDDFISNIFQISFGGYSVTAGRGNYFNQSYPFVFQQQLQTVLSFLFVQNNSTVSEDHLPNAIQQEKEKQQHATDTSKLFNHTLQQPFSWNVRNAAIGGCPSFPYGWCLQNFLGGIVTIDQKSNDNSTNATKVARTIISSPDVISWDFSMNEAGVNIDPIAGLEAYIRHTLTLPQYNTHTYNNNEKQPPKLVIKDTHMAIERKAMIQYYYDYYYNQSNNNKKEKENNNNNVNTMKTTYFDPVIVHIDPAIDPFIHGTIVEIDRPIGFQNWRKFGTPNGAPGQSLHHPAVQEHILIAWLLTMHFLPAIQLASIHYYLTNNNNNTNEDVIQKQHLRKKYEQYSLQCPILSSTPSSSTGLSNDKITNNPKCSTKGIVLPPPLYKGAYNHTAEPWSSMLYGTPVVPDNHTSSSPTDTISNKLQPWKMNKIYCRTTYEPIVQPELYSLSPDTVIATGSVGEDLNLLLPKSNMYYNRGWVLDISDEEKKVKRNLARYNNLNFIDTKKAYYGIVTSGTLQLFIPYIKQERENCANANFNDNSLRQPTVNDYAKDWFKSVTICEVNEKRKDPTECQTEHDVQFAIGGINIQSANSKKLNFSTTTMTNTTSSRSLRRQQDSEREQETTSTRAYSMTASGTMYLGKRLCMYLPIPDNVKLITKYNLLQNDTKFKNFIYPQSIINKLIGDTTIVGISVSLTVTNRHILKHEQACSISHVMWEQKEV